MLEAPWKAPFMLVQTALPHCSMDARLALLGPLLRLNRSRPPVTETV